MMSQNDKISDEMGRVIASHMDAINSMFEEGSVSLSLLVRNNTGDGAMLFTRDDIDKIVKSIEYLRSDEADESAFTQDGEVVPSEH